MFFFAFVVLIVVVWHEQVHDYNEMAHSVPAFSHQRVTTPTIRSPTALSCGGTFCSTMPQFQEMQQIPGRQFSF